MPFTIVRNDISIMEVDAIVNTANPKPVAGGGTDAAIHHRAGPGLLEARRKIGDISVGNAAVTKAFALHARYVIHTVGPVWQGGAAGEEALLRRCYDTSLELARKKRCASVAFPLISAGTYGFPKDRALQIALEAFSAFLLKHDMQIYLVVFDREVYQLSEKLLGSVASYIDENYVGQAVYMERRGRSVCCAPQRDCAPPMAPVMASAPTPSLKELLQKTDAGFTETLLKLIDQTGKKDSEIYRRANLTRQHFSKIRNNPSYRPTKSTALALAVALELDLEQTRDLIGRAGYALTNSSKFDVIVQYFISRRNYDMMEINAALFAFDQSLLGM